MTIKLSKVSLPNVWTKEFGSLHEAALELRKHICGTCMDGGEWGDREPLDVEFEGRSFVCMDVTELLTTACGFEFEIEGAPEASIWGLDPQELEGNAHLRRSKRKTAKRDLVAA